jgi:long-chain acyl-CoA synthetase
MDKPWLKHYPPGVPARIDVDAFPSLVVDRSMTASSRYRDRPAYRFMGKAITLRPD